MTEELESVKLSSAVWMHMEFEFASLFSLNLLIFALLISEPDTPINSDEVNGRVQQPLQVAFSSPALRSAHPCHCHQSRSRICSAQSSSALDLNADELIADGVGFCSHEELARSVHLLGMMSLPSSLWTARAAEAVGNSPGYHIFSDDVLVELFSRTRRRAAYHCIKKRERMDIVSLQTTLNTSQDQSPPGIQEEEKPKLQKTDQDQPQQPDLAFLRC
jgi:hypothetical protein